MGTRINHFIHRSRIDPAPGPLLGTGFTLTGMHGHNLAGAQVRMVQGASYWYGILGGLVIQLTNAAAASKITVRICASADGDTVIIPDTEADLVTGITTATVKTAAFRIDLPVEQPISRGDANFFVFAKVDAGTPNLKSSIITWME
jgi:hypothetical protein